MLIASRRRYFVPELAQRPGTVTAIHGVVFQNDGRSTVGRILIRPMEALDRWIVGILPRPGEQPLAMHAGIHVEIEGALDYVAEQLVGSFYLDLRNGLNWTPYEKFAERDRGGWDVTVPATCFRGVDQRVVDEAVRNLNAIQGHPFIGEDCTAFIERAFGGRRLFADSPLLRWFGVSVRIGDPALPLLRPDAALDAAARDKLQFQKIKDLPEALADPESPNFQLWGHRLIPLALVAGGATAIYSLASRRAGCGGHAANRPVRPTG